MIPRLPVDGDRAEVAEDQPRLADHREADGNHAHRARAGGVAAAVVVVGAVVAPAAVSAVGVSAVEDEDKLRPMVIEKPVPKHEGSLQTAVKDVIGERSC